MYVSGHYWVALALVNEFIVDGGYYSNDYSASNSLYLTPINSNNIELGSRLALCIR